MIFSFVGHEVFMPSSFDGPSKIRRSPCSIYNLVGTLMHSLLYLADHVLEDKNKLFQQDGNVPEANSSSKVDELVVEISGSSCEGKWYSFFVFCVSRCTSPLINYVVT